MLELVEREHRRGRVTVSSDPDVRPALLATPEQARPGIEQLVTLSDVVEVSDEDLRWLHPGRPDEDVARDWLDRGPALVVVTRGADGVLAVTGVRPPAIGARRPRRHRGGRRFVHGTIRSRQGCSTRWAVRTCSEARDVLPWRRSTSRRLLVSSAPPPFIAAITCSRPGADPPTRAELDSR